MVSNTSRIEALQQYFKGHNKSKEQKAHTSKVRVDYTIFEVKLFLLIFFPFVFSVNSRFIQLGGIVMDVN